MARIQPLGTWFATDQHGNLLLTELPNSVEQVMRIFKAFHLLRQVADKVSHQVMGIVKTSYICLFDSEVITPEQARAALQRSPVNPPHLQGALETATMGATNRSYVRRVPRSRW